MNLQNLVQRSSDYAPGPADPAIAAALASITPDSLRADVEAIAYPRHFQAQADNNRKAADYIADRLTAMGYTVEMQGALRNIVATRGGDRRTPVTLVGAHYDSVPGSPGADDNASAVAGLLACAAIVARFARGAPVMFVAFNCEEDGLAGSIDFVRRCVLTRRYRIRQAHIFEMIGYRDRRPRSQHGPPGLPLDLPDPGDWLGLLGSVRSKALLTGVLQVAATYVPHLPSLGLALPIGADLVFPVLRRSDHAPFWATGVPALMWTDTSEYRNPNYHKPTDTPDTLDYDFLADISRLAAASLLVKSGGRQPWTIHISRLNISPQGDL